jgi:hypothetical protein
MVLKKPSLGQKLASEQIWQTAYPSSFAYYCATVHHVFLLRHLVAEKNLTIVLRCI